MNNYNVALLPGDGVGPELIQATCQVLDTVCRKSGTVSLSFTEYPFGENAYTSIGEALPKLTVDGIRNSDATLLGAVSVKNVPSPSPIGAMRTLLDLYADIRVIRSWPGAWSLRQDIDLVCIRESTEGFLADRSLYQGYGEWMPNPDQVLSLRVVTRQKSERIARFAFEYAVANSRKKITVLHKNGVLKLGCGLFLEAVGKVAAEYPEIEFTNEYIDNAANHLITAPEDYDIILTTNLFGDIISDEAAALVSNLVPTANIGSGAVFLPVNHQHRPAEAGLGTVNPLPTLICAKMMLEHLGERELAGTFHNSLCAALNKGALLSRNTNQVVELICAAL